MPHDFACVDCGVQTGAKRSGCEYYMVHDKLWERVGMSKGEGAGCLCIGCLEKRLGRTLAAFDFTDAPINDPEQSWLSERLRKRLTA